jgi:alpha-glucosidase/alpha-D-xyloside xylohydrolase
MEGTPPGTGLPDIGELRNPEVEPICRKYLELRSRLMPYLYQAVREAHETGLPIMRALFLHYPDDLRAVARGDEYLWGRDILVAPVVEKGAASRRLYLPRGTWYDFWTGEKLEGGREITRPVDLATLPLHVRAGAIVPMGPARQYAAEKADAPVELVVYPGASGTFTLYEDDGTSFACERGRYSEVRCEWNEASRELILRPGRGSLSPSRNFSVRAVGRGSGRPVSFTGKEVRLRL